MGGISAAAAAAGRWRGTAQEFVSSFLGGKRCGRSGGATCIDTRLARRTFGPFPLGLRLVLVVLIIELRGELRALRLEPKRELHNGTRRSCRVQSRQEGRENPQRVFSQNEPRGIALTTCHHTTTRALVPQGADTGCTRENACGYLFSLREGPSKAAAGEVMAVQPSCSSSSRPL